MRRLRSLSASGAPDQGFVLVAVLIVVMLVSMLAASLIFRLKAEEQATVAGIHSDQAWGAAMSALASSTRRQTTRDPGSGRRAI